MLYKARGGFEKHYFLEFKIKKRIFFFCILQVFEPELNAKLVLKRRTFSHTKPEQRYRVIVKNELIELNKEKANVEYYKKFDYHNLVEV